MENKAEPRFRAPQPQPPWTGRGERTTLGGARRPLGGVVQRRCAGAVRSVAASAFVLQPGELPTEELTVPARGPRRKE